MSKMRVSQKNRLLRAWAVAAFVLFAPAAAQAAPVTLTFSGTYDTFDTTVFGLSGHAVPFSYHITYDPALNTNSCVFHTGQTIDGSTALNDFYGYSASGITALDMTFGTKTWATIEMLPLNLGPGITADMWFDTDISVSAPTRCDIYFADRPVSDLSLGYTGVGGGTIGMGNQSNIDDVPPDEPGGYAGGTVTITSTVPEPAGLALLALAALPMRRQRRSRHAADSMRQ
jgi:MYXO-CTERM domain-containing protein